MPEPASPQAPRPLAVAAEQGPDGALPCAVGWRGRWRRVVAVVERWRLDDEWWREPEIARDYFTVVLDDGRYLTLFHDRLADRWWTHTAPPRAVGPTPSSPPPQVRATAARSARAEYAELHAHSHYSLLDGASTVEELVVQARALGLRALALTDHDGLYGAPSFCRLAEAVGVQPIVGAELTLTTGQHLTLLAADDTGYRHLCRLLTLGRQARPKGEAAVTLAQVAAHSAGLLALSGCRRGVVAAPLLAGQPAVAEAAARWLREVFGPERCWIELQRHYLPGERALLRAQVALARRLGLGVVATNNVHYHVRERFRLHDVLGCVRHRTPLDAAHHLRRPNAEYYLKSPAQMARLFAELPAALRATLAIAERCAAAGEVARCALTAYRFPEFPLPPGETADSYLAARCREGALARYGTLEGEVGARLRHELGLIARHGLAGYFLIVWDLMAFARRQRIPAQGRGSAANSIVAYVLGLTNVDPIRHRLFVGRFLNEELATLPDIDIDFAREHREAVLQYVYERYGRDRAALVSTHVTYQARSALRDVGRALGLPAALVARLAREQERAQAVALPAAPPGVDAKRWRLLGELSAALRDYPRHLSQHVGGMVISACPLSELVPLEPARMAGRVVTQWDKDGVQDAGLIKIDLLSLGMLSLLDEATALIEARTGRRPDLAALPLDDPAVYDQICRADTIGVFQIESRAQQQSLPRTRPRCFTDLIAQVAIIRPGPLQGNMVHPYVRRKRGEEPVRYPHPRLVPVLEETLGVILYQEQCLRVAIEIAGFSAAEADALRRAMSRKRSRAALEALRERFVAGAVRQGIAAATAQQVFDLLRGFAAYGFCKSHAAAFALLTYQSAWLRCYYPAEFYAALLNNQPMGFYSPEVIVNEARRRGVPILPIDINRSRARCTVEPVREQGRVRWGVRLGWRYVRGLGPAALARLEAERAAGPFRSLADCCRRSGLPRAALENLILVGAFDRFGLPRRTLLWQLGLVYCPPRAQAPLPLPTEQDLVALPPLTPAEELQADYALSGLSPRYHPLGLLRPRLPRWVVDSTTVRGLRAGVRTWLAGMVVCRQRPPTAKGVLFLTLEDERGLANVIVPPALYERARRVLHDEGLVLVAGRVQRRDGVVNLVAERVEPLRAVWLATARSRDFA